MRNLISTAAIGVVLIAAQALAQTEETSAEGADVYRGDLPETHDAIALPEIGPSREGGGEASDQRLRAIAAGSLAAQQFGNLAASKQASGVVRDLGDAMILLHSGINERLEALGADGETRPAPLPETMPESEQQALNALRDTNGRAFNLGFATWVTDTYPYMVEGWRQLRDVEGFNALAGAVLPRLEAQLSAAEQVVAAGGNLASVDADIARTVTAGGGADLALADDGPTGAAGQTGERQHTPEPEPPAVQTGENYQHEQVEIDPQAQTRASTGGDGHVPAPFAAGDLEMINSAGLFMALENTGNELEQLRQAPQFGPDRVRVVAAEEIVEPADLEAAESSIAERRDEIVLVRGAIEENDALAGAVEQAGASLEDVVALDVIGEGAVVYTWTR